MDRITLDQMYMEIAQVIAKRSSCTKRKVGCIIVKNNQIIAEGYNGTPPGWKTNECEDEEGNTKPCVSHAESNAISKAASSSISCRNGTIYCTLQPCFDCAKQIIQSGISRVVYMASYRDSRPLNYFQKCGIKVDQMNHDSTKH